VRSRLLARGTVLVTALTAALTCGLAAPPAAQAQTIQDREWFLDAMQAPQMWQVSTGRGVTVAVIDGGVDATAPELKGKLLPGKDYVGGGDGWQDADGHGTAMAMLIAGNGASGSGVMGLAPGARILPITVIPQGVNNSARLAQNIAAAVRYATDHGAKVINLSLGMTAFESSPGDRAPLEPAIKYALSHDSLVFAASGNDGERGNSVAYPAATPGAVGVSAVDQSWTVTKFSTYGPQIALSAPGKDMPGRCTKSLGTQQGYCLGSGTSEATAIASASAALIWAKHSDWTNNQVLRVMINTAGKPKTGKVPSIYGGYGTVRPRIALLDSPGDPGPANVNPLFPNLFATPPSPSASKSPAPAARSRTAAAKDSNGNTLLWAGLSIGGLAVVGLATVVIVRRRKNAQGLPAIPSAPTQLGSYPGQMPPPPPNPYQR
jgi:type VII secretion-associated serine protease mycosin